jgi:hypothetical protein
MGFGNRAFLVGKDDTVHKFSYSKLDRLLMGDSQELLPEMANSRIRYAIIRLETRHRRPVGVIGAEFGFVKLDHAGRVDEDERARQLRDSMKLYDTYMEQEAYKARVGVSDAPSSLIHAVHRFVRRGYDRRYRWKPSDKVLATIGAAIFGTV